MISMTEGYIEYCQARHVPQLISPAQDQFVVRVEQPSGEQAERHGRQADEHGPGPGVGDPGHADPGQED